MHENILSSLGKLHLCVCVYIIYIFHTTALSIIDVMFNVGTADIPPVLGLTMLLTFVQPNLMLETMRIFLETFFLV